MHWPERAGAPRGRAAQPRWRRRPPTHSQPHGPRKTARTKGQTCAGARRDSETLSWRRPAAAARGRRGPAAAAVPATRTTTRGRTHARHTPRNSESKPHRPANLSRDQSRVSEDDDDIHVIKRNGKKEVVRYDKITSRIKKLCYGLDSKYIKPNVLTQKVIQGVYDGVTTHELDELAAQTAAYMATQHPDFSRLAARISVSNLHKSTDKVFSDVVEKLHKHVHPKTKKPASLIADDVYEVIMSNKDKINGAESVWISASFRTSTSPRRRRRDATPP